jgi:hypothetical protein
MACVEHIFASPGFSRLSGAPNLPFMGTVRILLPAHRHPGPSYSPGNIDPCASCRQPNTDDLEGLRIAEIWQRRSEGPPNDLFDGGSVVKD